MDNQGQKGRAGKDIVGCEGEDEGGQERSEKVDFLKSFYRLCVEGKNPCSFLS